jgi:hypothetical protein
MQKPRLGGLGRLVEEQRNVRNVVLKDCNPRRVDRFLVARNVQEEDGNEGVTALAWCLVHRSPLMSTTTSEGRGKRRYRPSARRQKLMRHPPCLGSGLAVPIKTVEHRHQIAIEKQGHDHAAHHDNRQRALRLRADIRGQGRGQQAEDGS